MQASHEIVLSIEKQAFLKQKELHAQKLEIHEIVILAEKYSRKLGVKIYVHGYLQRHNISLLPLTKNESATQTQEHSDDENEHDDESDVSEYHSESITHAVAQDILSIQQTLKPNEYVGYLYNMERSYEQTFHVECFIISQEKIIQPVNWYTEPEGFISQGYFLDVAKYVPEKTLYISSNLYPFNEEKLIPQVDVQSCATLSLQYLKKCLANNAQLLREESLSIPYYSDTGELNFFFLPPAQLLQYTQKNAFNLYLNHMVKNKDSGSFTYHRSNGRSSEYEYTSIESILDGLEHVDIDNSIVNAEITRTRKLWPTFKQRWLTAYESTTAKHAAMAINNKEDHSINYYLAYTTQRLKTRAHQMTVQFSSHQNKTFTALRALCHSPFFDEQGSKYMKKNHQAVSFLTGNQLGYIFDFFEDEHVFLNNLLLFKEMLNTNVSIFKLFSQVLSQNKRHLLKQYFKSPTHLLQFLGPNVDQLFSWLPLFDHSLKNDHLPFIEQMMVFMRNDKNILHSYQKNWCTNHPSMLKKTTLRQMLELLTITQRGTFIDFLFGEHHEQMIHTYDLYDLFCPLLRQTQESVLNEKKRPLLAALSTQSLFKRPKQEPTTTPSPLMIEDISDADFSLEENERQFFLSTSFSAKSLFKQLKQEPSVKSVENFNVLGATI